MRRTEVDELGRPEEFKVDERFGRGQVLHVVAVGSGEDSSISGLGRMVSTLSASGSLGTTHLEVEGTRGATSSEGSGARMATDNVLPLWWL